MELSDSDEEVWPLSRRGRSRFEPVNEHRQRSTQPIEAAEEVEEEPVLEDVEEDEETTPISLPLPVPVVTRTNDARLQRLKDKVRYV